MRIAVGTARHVLFNAKARSRKERKGIWALATEKPRKRGWTRRRFLLLTGAGGVAVCSPVRFCFYPDLGLDDLTHFSGRQASILGAIITTILPPDAPTEPEAIAEHVRFIDGFLDGIDPAAAQQFGALIYLVEHLTLPFGPHLRRSSRLSDDDRIAYMRSWQENGQGMIRLGFRSLKTLVFMSYYRDTASWKAIGYAGPTAWNFEGPPQSLRRYDPLRALPNAQIGYQRR